MPALEREIVDITAVIKSILDNYPAGSAVLREFLQNSDDCGAKSQEFILDTRTFHTEALVDPQLACCQGPALFAINDGHFNEKDWSALKHIHNSSKTADETSTGKYGLGFRSCYHVTDNPHILSGNKLLILDPHNRVEQYPGGFSLRLDNSEDRLQYRDHFRAFQAVLGEGDRDYDGTAIRLPVRLENEARRSGIKTVPTSVEDVRVMFQNFIQRELREVMLFLKNIVSIGLYEIRWDGIKKQIARAWIEDPGTVAPHRSVNRGRQEESSTYELCVRVQDEYSTSSRGWVLTQFVENYQAAERIMTTQCGNALSHLMAAEKLFPHVALAYPIPETPVTASLPIRIPGKLFTLLPLPIITGFPLHIHAIFALASSRQSLRNLLDVTTGSREEYLIQWNRAIFLRFVPKAWVVLLKHAAKKTGPLSMRPYDLWPEVEAGDQVYWKGLSEALLQCAAPERIWPAYRPHLEEVSTTEYYTLVHVLLAPVNTATELLDILRDCAVLTSNPPTHVYILVQSSEVYRSRLMTPSTVANAIRSKNPRLNGATSNSRAIISEYISTANDINLFRDVPVIPCVDGTWTSIKQNNTYILATNTEAELFHGVDPQVHLLALDLIGVGTKSVLLSTRNNRIHLLQPTDIVNLLVRRCSSFRSGTATLSTGVGAEDVAWLVRFWNWIGGWQDAQDIWSNTTFRSRVSNLHNLPLSTDGGRHEIRLFGKATINPVGMDDELLQVFHQLRLPVLHSGIATLGPLLRHGVQPLSDVTFLLSELRDQPSFSLSQLHSARLHDYFTTHLPALRQRLQPSDLNALRLLPIYPVLRPGLRTTQGYTFEAGPESSWLVDDTIEVVPIIQGRPIIAASECRPILAAVYRQHQMNIARESEVLEQAIRTWEQQRQDQNLVSLLVGRIISRLGDLSWQALELVARIPIVDVGRDNLRSPAETVDPMSNIAQLFDADEGVLPQGLFAPNSSVPYLRQLRNCGLLLSNLTADVVTERIGRLTDPATSPPHKDAKARALLQLLDDFSKTPAALPKETVLAITSKPWLLAGDTYRCSSQGWDRRSIDVPLCDRILPMVNYVVSSTRLRKVLGWQALPFDVLKRQYLAVVSEVTTPDAKDVIPIIQALAQRLDVRSCNEVDLKALAQTLDGKPWVPGSDGCCLPLHYMVLQNVDLGSHFHQVSQILITDQRVLRCLRVMGIPDRPTYNALYSGLADISSELDQSGIDESARSLLISTSLKILSEIFPRNPSAAATPPDRSRVFIPTTTYHLHPIDSTFFNDMGSDISGNEDSFLAHPDISASFAETMGLVRLSDRQFATEDDLLGDMQLGEDFCGRIRGVLKDYRMESASNEWIANADDAKATHVGFVVDGASFKGTKLLTPQSAEQCQSPALVIWNSETFTERDFKGLLSTGEGGKRGNHGAIGRFGLGALSFYHFTEMAMVVSGDRVLFLDPSGTYLPRSARRSNRTALLMSLENCQSKYPDHVRPLDGLFEFSNLTSHYKGTIFRLPLRTPQQAETSKLSTTPYSVTEIQRLVKSKFYDQAEQSLFFSHIVKISAQQRNPGMEKLAMWSIHGTRQCNATEMAGDRLEGDQTESMEMRLETTVMNGPARVQNWLIYSTRTGPCGIPEEFRHLVDEHRLPSPSIGLAMRLTTKESGAQGHLSYSRLFATVPLPIETRLPVHIHATWILAGDRRTIRFDAKTADGARPMDTKYNLYLLESLLPGLYLRLLATLASQYPRDWNRCWPTRTHDHLQPLVKEVYRQFVGTTDRVCRTVTGEAVAPAQALFSVSNSRHVQAVLEALRLPYFVYPLPFDESLVAWGSLQTDVPGRIVEIILRNSGAVRQLFKEGLPESQPSSQPPHPSFARKHLDGVIQYLGNERLTELPLLQLGDGDIATFDDVHKPWIFREISNTSLTQSILSISTLFTPRRVIGPAISDATCELLIKRGGNVRILDADGIRQLLGITPCNSAIVSEERMQWLPKFLTFLASCKTVTLNDISDLPLIPAVNGNVAISLIKARDSTVFTTFSVAGMSSPDLLIRLGILVIQSVPVLPFKPLVNLGTLMEALRSLGKNLARLNEGISDHDWKSLTQWIKENLGGLRRLNQSDRKTLLAIPIFEAQRGGQVSAKALHPANEIHMLPQEVQLTSLARYLPQSTYFADYSYDLSAALDGRPGQVLSHQDLFRHLQLPATISLEEDHHFQHVLWVVTSNRRGGNLSSPLVPDMDRILRKPEQLYDHRVDLFVAAFGSRPTKFVHPTYRTSIDSFVQVGLRTELDLPTLIECAIAIDEDVRRGGFNQDRAAEFWSFFADSNAIRGLSLNTIANLRFIPYDTRRHDVPEFAPFARPLRDVEVASPQELVRTEHAPVAWTQRACFATTLPPFIAAIMPDLGVPSAEEVVRHLEVLAMVIAPQHRWDRSLQRDLFKTYDWLLARVGEVRHHLAQRKTDLLWLNITDSSDEWTWRSGSQLIFDLRFDDPERNHYDVKDRLLPYKDLLLIAGAHEQARLTVPEGFAIEAETTHSEGLRLELEDLRQNNWLTDIQFEISGEVIRAHRAVLAAAVSHFKDALTSSYQEGEMVASAEMPMVFPTPWMTSAFAMRSVVDYAYTGTFTHPPCGSADDAGRALEDLLALMDLSNMWMIDKLKNKTERAIIELGLVRQETYMEVLERAEACDATVLARACRTTQAHVAQW